MANKLLSELHTTATSSNKKISLTDSLNNNKLENRRFESSEFMQEFFGDLVKADGARKRPENTSICL